MALAERVAIYPGVMRVRFETAERDRNRNVPQGATVVSPEAMAALTEHEGR